VESCHLVVRPALLVIPRLFGGLIGSAIASLGVSGVKWDGVVSSVVIPAIARTGGRGSGGRGGHPDDLRRRGQRARRSAADSGFRWGQIGSASLVSLAHGTNDAQKTMGSSPSR
jgi:PiT family inorganic phosphate transporter